MAISAPSSSGATATGVISGSIAVTVTITAGETGWLYFGDEEGASAAAVTSVVGGGVWAKVAQKQQISSARMKGELWTTAPGAATSAASVTVNYSGAPNAVVAVVASYPGVLGIGSNVTNSGTGANPTCSLVTQDANNWLVSGFNTWLATVPTAATTGVFRRGAGVASTSDEDVALIDNTVAGPGSVTTTLTLAASEWVAIGVEFRSVAPSPGAAPLAGSLFVGPRLRF